jgi:hypothetical protein
MSETRTASPEQIRKMSESEFKAYKKKMGMPDAVTKNHLVGKSSLNPIEYNFQGRGPISSRPNFLQSSDMAGQRMVGSREGGNRYVMQAMRKLEEMPTRAMPGARTFGGQILNRVRRDTFNPDQIGPAGGK